ncbi:hypothetical protein PV08_03014 [Exophiala spinifera]|uniref:Major facilitator superfamily (MFS) profile domain-containing protein n=1 Tax=Exophiala spinifera TaxID=91928 RepID=A0A0D2BJE2_9EURO|nr:uncharacterized protein PV08_03014 [Exophiala spinifera]KIW18725.1 hypothetical protein PV08_03014 [Exophiala spinifera]
MAFGVLQSARNPRPRGTVVLESIPSTSSTGGGGRLDLILVPTPSPYPADPLNWSRIRKELYFLTILFGACLTGVIGPVLVPGFTIIVATFNVSLTQVTLLNGSLVMALGVSSYLCACLAEVTGKRPVFLATSVLLVASSCWGAAAKSYGSLLAARIFQGLGMGSFFALAGTISINDVFFVHERGLRVGLWNSAVIASVNLAPVISSHIIVNLGWPWAFWILAISFGVLLVAVTLFFPETSYSRSVIEGENLVLVDHGHRTSITGSNIPEKVPHQDSTAPYQQDRELQQGDSEQLNGSLTLSSLLHPCPAPLGSFVDFLKAVATPLLLLRHPATIWACVMWSVTFTWVIIQGAVASQIFAYPPYNMTPTAVGNLIGIAPLIGSLLGTLIGGPLCDVAAVQLSSRNGGIYEPEFRLCAILVGGVVPFVVGAYGLGAAVAGGLSPATCGFFLAAINFAVGTSCTGIVAYSNDVFGEDAGEVFGLAMVVKSAFAFGLTFMFNDYYANHGPKVFFYTWGSLTVGALLFGTAFLYVYGKRIRAWMDQ